jgi:CRISPR-associated protein Csb2
LEEPQLDALGVLCDRLTYLGRADSICLARLVGSDESDELPPGYQRVGPVVEDQGDRDSRLHGLLAAARPLQIDALQVRAQQLRRRGRIEPPGSHRVLYPVVDQAEPVSLHVPRPAASGMVAAVRLRITTSAPPSRRATLAMTEALRHSTLRTFDPKGSGRASIALFGRDGDGRRVDDDHAHAHYLAFTSKGSTRPALDTMLVWAPGGLVDAEVAALADVPWLRGRRFVSDFRPCRVAVEATGSVEDIAPELHGPSCHWESFTPYAPPRNVRRQPTWHDHAVAYLRRDLAAAGFPEARITPSSGQWLSFRRHRIGERLSDARRSSGFHLEFDEPVGGPISLGALRHLGLGLFVPVSGPRG